MSDELPIGVEERTLDDVGLEALAEAVAASPPPALRERLLEVVQRDQELRRAGARLGRWRAAGIAALAASLAFAAFLVQERGAARESANALAALEATRSELEARLATQERELAAKERELASLSESLAVQGQVVRILSKPVLRRASLAPQAGHAGSARVLVDPTTGDLALVTAGLDPLPAGTVCQLWAIRGAAPPEPAGVFTPGETGELTARMPPVPRPDEVTAFAVSMEPEGGSPAPTGPILLAGALEL